MNEERSYQEDLINNFLNAAEVIETAASEEEAFVLATKFMAYMIDTYFPDLSENNSDYNLVERTYGHRTNILRDIYGYTDYVRKK
ncbi:hypothetical protein M0R19_03650 [Candidatus Pacearchaeota archaeon]|jgi:hypothetical protein|nr:hypothetical protein [Candidatus Pacearchaeota archaeon]